MLHLFWIVICLAVRYLCYDKGKEDGRWEREGEIFDAQERE